MLEPGLSRLDMRYSQVCSRESERSIRLLTVSSVSCRWSNLGPREVMAFHSMPCPACVTQGSRFERGAGVPN